MEYLSEDKIIFLDYNKNDERIELSITNNIDKKFADEFISDKIVLFNSLFQLRRVSYPGQHTKYIECPDKFRPEYFEKKVRDGELKYFIGFSNSNFVAGACSDDLVVYKSIHGFLYCNNKSIMIELDYFTELNQSDNIYEFIQRIDCEIY
jgi:hypothetical protein